MTYRRWPIVLIGLLLGCHRPGLLAAQMLAQPDTFELIGVVRDEASGRPLPGVLIQPDTSREHRVFTDSTGSYRVAALRRGNYSVAARKIGYYVERREITVSCPVIVTDERDRALYDPGPCDTSPATLNFYLRPQNLR